MQLFEALVGTPWSTQASSVMMQGTYTGLQPLTRPHLPELDLWYTAQTVALLEVRKIFGHGQKIFAGVASGGGCRGAAAGPDAEHGGADRAAALHLHPAAHQVPGRQTLPQAGPARSYQGDF